MSTRQPKSSFVLSEENQLNPGICSNGKHCRALKMLFWISLFATTSPTLLHSQEKGKIGIGFKAGSSSTVGITWHFMQRFAVRTSFGYSWSRFDYEDMLITNGEPKPVTSSISANLAFLCYAIRRGAFSTYIAPYIGYGRGTSWSSSSTYGNTFANFEIVNQTYSTGGILGLQYSIVPRVSLFGEMGFGFDHLAATGGPPASLASRYKRNTWALSNAGVGVLIYIN
jgi:hypothetical protein